MRKTPSLLKASVNFPYGWDGRFARVQDAARGAILSPVEMNGIMVTDDQLDALAAFVLALPGSEPSTTTPTPPDLSSETLTRIATGKTIFFGKGTCVSCHVPPTFTTNKIAIDEVLLNFTGGTDPGAAFVGTGARLGFKVPSLLFLDADRPFMHNGAMGTLTELVTFYNTSFALNLTGPELTGLAYWLRNCLDPRRSPIPGTC